MHVPSQKLEDPLTLGTQVALEEGILNYLPMLATTEFGISSIAGRLT
jgi:hypothetical protein